MECDLEFRIWWQKSSKQPNEVEAEVTKAVTANERALPVEIKERETRTGLGLGLSDTL